MSISRVVHVVRCGDTNSNFADVKIIDAIAFKGMNGQESVFYCPAAKAIPIIKDSTGDGNGKAPGNPTRASHMERTGSGFDVEILDAIAYKGINGQEELLYQPSASAVEGSTRAITKNDQTITDANDSNNTVVVHRVAALAFKGVNGQEELHYMPGDGDTEQDITKYNSDGSPPANSDPHVYVYFPSSFDGQFNGDVIKQGSLWWIVGIGGLPELLQDWYIEIEVYSGSGASPDTGVSFTLTNPNTGSPKAEPQLVYSNGLLVNPSDGGTYYFIYNTYYGSLEDALSTTDNSYDAPRYASFSGYYHNLDNGNIGLLPGQVFQTPNVEFILFTEDSASDWAGIAATIPQIGGTFATGSLVGSVSAYYNGTFVIHAKAGNAKGSSPASSPAELFTMNLTGVVPSWQMFVKVYAVGMSGGSPNSYPTPHTIVPSNPGWDVVMPDSVAAAEGNDDPVWSIELNFPQAPQFPAIPSGDNAGLFASCQIAFDFSMQHLTAEGSPNPLIPMLYPDLTTPAQYTIFEFAEGPNWSPTYGGGISPFPTNWATTITGGPPPPGTYD